MHVRESLGVSERRSCRVIGQHRSTQRKSPQEKVDEELLTRDIIKLSREYGRYAYRRIAVLLKNTGWQVNAKRVERIWRREGLKVPMKQPKRGRLWFNDGSCVRLRALRPNHVWSYNFVHDRTYDGKAFKTLKILDEYTRECLSIRIDRSFHHQGIPRIHQIWQWTWVCSEVGKKLDLSSRSKNCLYRTRQSVGKWILWKL